MHKFVYSAFVFSAFLLFSYGSFAEDVSQIAAAKAFQDADLMDDDAIDPAEFETYHQKIFPSLDLNSDGKVTFGECVGGCFAANPGVDAAAISGHVSYRFEAIDANGDKELTLQEYIEYARDRFPYYDSNGDAWIDINEFCAFYNESLPCTFKVSPTMMKE